MWVLYARAPTPNVPYWPGRRRLALIDAILWPSLVAFSVTRMPMDPGVAGQVALALCALSAVRRCTRALWRNECYRFTTWRVCVALFGMLVFGAVLKLAASHPLILAPRFYWRGTRWATYGRTRWSWSASHSTS